MPLRRLTYRALGRLGVGGALLVAAAACGVPRETPPTLADARQQLAPTHESWDVTFVVSEAGGMVAGAAATDGSRPRLAVEAGYLATFDTPDSTYTLMRGTDDAAPDDAAGAPPVRIHLFDAAGDTSATVTAQRVFYYEEDRRFEAFDAVTVVTSEGRLLRSEHLRWKETERRVYVDGFARLTTPNERVAGYGFTADEDLTSYAMARVTGQVDYEEE